MEVEVKAKNYSESDEKQSFVERCTVIVKTTDDNGNVTEAEEKGCIIQGKEMVFLNSQNVYLPNLPTERQDIAGAFEEVLGKLQDGEGGDWQPPDWWIPVPEPEPYEMYFLVEVTNLSAAKIEINLCDPETSYMGFGPLAIDWGDGTTETYEGYPTGQMWMSPSHNYTEQGQFLIKITASEQSSCLKNLRNNPITLIMKLGDEICVTSEAAGNANAFYNQYRLHYVKLSGKNGLYVQAFQNCHALRKIDIKNPLTIIPSYCFNSCYNLKKLDFSEVEIIEGGALANTGITNIDAPKCNSIGEYGINYCYYLEKVNAPLCKTVGQSCFVNDYILSEAVFADDCTFGSGCFAGCYNLYPHPDGSVN